jgi:hypothetical protein
MARKRRLSDIKPEYRLKDGSVMVIRREENGLYGVEQFDSNDMSRWHKTFQTFDEARVEFDKWRDNVSIRREA